MFSLIFKSVPNFLSNINQGPQKPTFPAGCKSLLSKYLTDDVWEKCKNKKDKVGFTFQECINSGVVNLNSGVGVYAGSESTYTVFAPLLDRIIESYHGHKPDDKHVTDWDVNKIPSEPLDPTDQFILSTRVRIARNSNEYPFGTKISREQRKDLENKAIEAFKTFQGDLQGVYYALGAITSEQQEQLRKDHFLFQGGDKYLEACGLNRDWPESRGIFHNNNKTFLIWLNEEDHFRIISMQNGGDIREVFDRLARAAAHIEKTLSFARNDHLGAITTCPTNCGTGLRASVMIKLPNLSKPENYKQFEAIADKYYVQIRGTDGEHSESKGGVYDISNKRRLGRSEADLVSDMYEGVKAMIAAEKQLASQ